MRWPIAGSTCITYSLNEQAEKLVIKPREDRNSSECSQRRFPYMYRCGRELKEPFPKEAHDAVQKQANQDCSYEI